MCKVDVHEAGEPYIRIETRTREAYVDGSLIRVIREYFQAGRLGAGCGWIEGHVHRAAGGGSERPLIRIAGVRKLARAGSNSTHARYRQVGVPIICNTDSDAVAPESMF